MGFVSEVLKDVNGLLWYYIIGIFIFIALFILIVYKTIKTPKAELLKYKNAILEEDVNTQTPLNNSND